MSSQQQWKKWIKNKNNYQEQWIFSPPCKSTGKNGANFLIFTPNNNNNSWTRPPDNRQDQVKSFPGGVVPKQLIATNNTLKEIWKKKQRAVFAWSVGSSRALSVCCDAWSISPFPINGTRPAVSAGNGTAHSFLGISPSILKTSTKGIKF